MAASADNGWMDLHLERGLARLVSVACPQALRDSRGRRPSFFSARPPQAAVFVLRRRRQSSTSAPSPLESMKFISVRSTTTCCTASRGASDNAPSSAECRVHRFGQPWPEAAHGRRRSPRDWAPADRSTPAGTCGRFDGRRRALEKPDRRELCRLDENVAPFTRRQRHAADVGPRLQPDDHGHFPAARERAHVRRRRHRFIGPRERVGSS